MTIAEMPISCPFCVYDVTLGHFVFSVLDTSAPGDIPPDIASLPVVGIRSVGNVLYIDIEGGFENEG